MPVVCRLEDITDGEARGFELTGRYGPLAIVCVRQGGHVFAYRNRCPHTGINLEWQPDQFLDDTKNYLVCSTHGALFQVEDGACVAGPCAGDSLDPVTVQVRAGDVVVDLDGE